MKIISHKLYNTKKKKNLKKIFKKRKESLKLKKKKKENRYIII